MADFQYDHWPTGNDAKAMLVSAGFWPTDATLNAGALTQADNAVESAVAEFENNTGWHPFLSSGATNETRYYDQITARGKLILDDGLLTLTSATVAGQPFIVNSGVFAEPTNASNQNKPYTVIKFYPQLYRQYIWPVPRSIAITGEWGRFRTVPPDAWNAVLRAAAVNALSVINQDYALASRSEDGFTEQYDVVGAIQPKDILGVWPKDYMRVVEKYKRVSVG